MRHSLLSIPLALFMCTALGAGAPVQPEVLAAHAKKIGEKIPANWSARVDEDGTGVWVERKDAVPMVNMAPSQSFRQPGDPPLTGQCRIFLRARGPATKEQLAALNQANTDRDKALEMLRAQMTDMLPTATVKPSGGDAEDYVPRTPEQKARLEAFVAVKKAMPSQVVPDLFAADVSFRLDDDFYLVPAKPEDKLEMAFVVKQIRTVYSDTPLK